MNAKSSLERLTCTFRVFVTKKSCFVDCTAICKRICIFLVRHKFFDVSSSRKKCVSDIHILFCVVHFVNLFDCFFHRIFVDSDSDYEHPC